MTPDQAVQIIAARRALLATRGEVLFQNCVARALVSRALDLAYVR
jgi:hypothetical protein